MAQILRPNQHEMVDEIAGDLLELTREQVFLEQLFLEPERNRHFERAKATRRKRYIGFQQPLEFEERLVVEHDMVEAVGVDAGFRPEIGDGVVRKIRVMLLAGKALLLRGGDDAAL